MAKVTSVASSAGSPGMLVDIRSLSVALPQGSDRKFAVENVSLSIGRGEVLCLVGESGSGKSVLASAIAGLLPKGQLAVEQGRIGFLGHDIVSLSEAALRTLRGKRIGYIFQEPMTALNPVMTVGRQIEEALEAHNWSDAAGRRARVLELVRATQLPDPENIIWRYPHQLSGGQRQRVMIAAAIANEPDLLIADEPTTALDVTTQAEILKLILDIRTRLGLSVLFITHDFGVVSDIADRVVVMRDGQVVEAGTASDVLNNPQHAYTRKLLDAVPSLDTGSNEARVASPLLSIRDVSKTYGGGSLFGRQEPTRALDSINLDIRRGEVVALVGESGSGKTTLGQCVAGILNWDSGAISFDGKPLAGARRDRRERPRIQMVFQDPFSSLNGRHSIRRILTEAAIAHGLPRAAAEARMLELLRRVGLDASAAERYPHAFSGGQRQRIGIARALMLQPELLVADEPVSALDVSIQRQILELIAEIRTELGLSMLFVTHDLRVASTVADRIAVIQRGRIVEQGPPARLLASPQSDYARKLLAAVPGMEWESRRTEMSGPAW